MSAAGYGVGAYSLPEAGRLLGMPSATLKNWLFGYSYEHHGPQKNQLPVWSPEYGVNQDEPLLGFRDLVEARIVRRLRLLNIGLPTIRECMKLATEIVQDSHPFSTKLFRTDGQKIFLEVTHEAAAHNADAALIDLKSRQRVFKTVVAPSFVDLDYEDEAAARWWLLPNKTTIVLDPARSFGQPIVAERGIPTARLVQAHKAEGSVERVARIFELAPRLVRDALTFERVKFKLAA
jgi:uncharacterized protein (DUF433 family)